MGIACFALNAGSSFKPSEAFSIQIATEDQAETDRPWHTIIDNGGSENACALCKDRWGYSWQITPRALSEGTAEPDRAAAKRVMQAMMTMHGTDGEVVPQKRIHLAYEEGRRIVATDAVSFDGDLVPTGPMIGFCEIAPGGDGTRYTGRARHWTEEAKKQHEDMGFVQGWSVCADQLAELCEAG